MCKGGGEYVCKQHENVYLLQNEVSPTMVNDITTLFILFNYYIFQKGTFMQMFTDTL